MNNKLLVGDVLLMGIYPNVGLVYRMKISPPLSYVPNVLMDKHGLHILSNSYEPNSLSYGLQEMRYKLNLRKIAIRYTRRKF